MTKPNKYTKKILENDNIYTIFYSDWCGYCENAINLLKKHNLSFKGYKIDKIDGGIETLIQSLTETKDLTNYNPTHTSRPIIFNKSKFIGGYSDLLKELEK